MVVYVGTVILWTYACIIMSVSSKALSMCIYIKQKPQSISLHVTLCSQEQYALNQICSDQDLSDIAGKLENWEIFCAYLSISSAEQTELKRNHQQDYKSQKIQALKLWKQKVGRKATYESLVGIFKKLDYNDFAEDIIDLALEAFKSLYSIVVCVIWYHTVHRSASVLS